MKATWKTEKDRMGRFDTVLVHEDEHTSLVGVEGACIIYCYLVCSCTD